jgi:precorrin-4/cobalt-precorrin-4 C11-methyltransferase
MSEKELYPVIFVGAGPGDPDLITVAGRRALEEADLVVYAGSLVSRDMLGWCRPEAECVDSAGLDLPAIVERLVSGHRTGRRVVRLHTGDPSLYGAVNEQFAVLGVEGVPYRVIPGVSAAFAAAAALRMEYTLPEVCQTLILTRAAGRTPVPEAEDLASLAVHNAGMVIYLSAGRAGATAEALAGSYGWAAPAAVVYRASWPDEKIVLTTLERLAQTMAEAGIGRQALIIVGPAVEALVGEKGSPRSKLYDPGFSHGYRGE